MGASSPELDAGAPIDTPRDRGRRGQRRRGDCRAAVMGDQSDGSVVKSATPICAATAALTCLSVVMTSPCTCAP